MPRRSSTPVEGSGSAAAPEDKPVSSAKPRAISRFIVMAILQAARAERLGLPEKSAYSWGLNRAIFFAAAKQGFGHGGASGGVGQHEGRKVAAPAAPDREEYRLGDELAYRDPRASTLYFTIGGDTQTEKEFQRQIIARFGDAAHFDRAWKEATGIVAAASPESLRSGREFYQQVYRPRRDELKDSWSEMIGAK